MFNVVASLIDGATDFLGTFGYFGIFLLSFLDRLTVFIIPAEIVLPAYGILVSQGQFTFTAVLLWVTIGNLLGNLALFFISLKGGRMFLEKYGKYIFVSKHELGHLDRWFYKYGDKIVFFGYLIPTAIRSLVPIPAGLSRMKVSKFSLYTLLGSFPLNFLYIYIGMKAGDNLDSILRFFERFNYTVIAAIIILIVWYVYRHRNKKHLTHD